MVHALENHPQRQKAIDLILSGESVRVIAAQLDPPVSFQAVQRYRKGIVKPVLARSATLAKVLGKDKSMSREEIAAVTQDVTKEALLAAPVLAVREQRLSALQDRHERLRLVMQERAVDMADAPGGKSGLLVRKLKSIGSGLNAREVEEYELDTGLLAEFREHEKQAAMELGQWQEGNGSGTTNIYMLTAPAIVFGSPSAPEPVGPVIDVTPEK